MIGTFATPAARTADAVLDYLRRRLGVNGLSYRQPPVAIPNGWETNTYQLQLAAEGSLPAAYTRRLVLRAYTRHQSAVRACHEFAAQQCVFRRGYPVPQPLLVEEDPAVLGGPFLLMEWVPGKTLLDFLLSRPWRIWGYPAAMAELQCRLHDMPVGNFPAPHRAQLSRHLEQLEGIIHTCHFDGLRPGLDWLHEHQPEAPAAPCIVHLDFHPLNMLIADGRYRAVLDWGDADVGDPHADVAATLVLLDATQLVMGSWRRWLLSKPGRRLLRWGYLHSYAKRRPLDPGRLRYYLAWAALRRLAIWGEWFYTDPPAPRVSAGAQLRLTPKRLAYLARYFESHSGVPVRLRPFSRGSSLALA
jgi:aminoglycoside phosphotransferase (APT) family kinase protein